MLKVETLGKFGEDLVQLFYFAVLVRRRHLHTETHLRLGHQRVRSEGDVNPAFEEEPPNRVDVFGMAKGDLNDRVTRGVQASSGQGGLPGRAPGAFCRSRSDGFGHPRPRSP